MYKPKKETNTRRDSDVYQVRRGFVSRF